MTWSVVLLKNNVVVQTFGTHPPLISAENASEHDSANPPRLTAIRRTVTIEGILYGKDSNAKTNYDALVAQAENATSYPDGLQVKDPSGAVVLDLSGHDFFKIERVTFPKSDRQWRNEIAYTVQVSAVRRFTRIAEGTTVEISGLTLRESWSYDEAGLVTQTLDGTLTTPQGVSAVATAQALGLALPGPTFAYVTNGPGGCDIQQLNEADTSASFTSTIRQVGGVLPDGVGPSFRVNTETTISNGEKIEVTTVTAVGPGAEAAVAAKLPNGAQIQSSTKEPFSRSAAAVYVKRTPMTGDSILRSHVFTSTGGDRPILYTQRAGGRSPLQHKGSFRVVEIEERITVEVFGIPKLERFKYPPPVKGLTEDRSKLSTTGPYVSEPVKDLTGMRWALDVRRTYSAKDFHAAFLAISLSSFSARASSALISTNPSEETENQKSGKD